MAETNTNETATKTVKAARYTGKADVRKLTAADWKKVGAEGQNQVIWDRSNQHTVKLADLSKEAAKYLEEAPDFEVIDVAG